MPRKFAIVYTKADAKKEAMATIQSAVSHFEDNRASYGDGGQPETGRPPAGVYDYIAFFGGHGDISGGQPSSLIGRAASSWQAWVLEAKNRGVRAKHIILDCCLSASFVRIFSPLLAAAEFPHTACTIVGSISSSYGTLNITAGQMLGETVSGKMQDEWDQVGARRQTYKFRAGATIPALLDAMDLGDDTAFQDVSGQWKVGDFTIRQIASSYGQDATAAEAAVNQARSTGLLVVQGGGSSARFIPRSVYVYSPLGGTLHRCGGFANADDEKAAYGQWEDLGGGGGARYDEFALMMGHLKSLRITVEDHQTLNQLKAVADSKIRVIG
jgi:hypothetical protein